MSIAEQIAALYADRGHEAYYGENVSQLEHALQAAWLAEQDQASDSLVVAALLHDIGHLITDDEDAADNGLDTRHEQVGDEWLRKWFPLDVTEPVRMHVAAKRYLCSTKTEYFDALSEASQLSFRLQGGPMSESEILEFESSPYFVSALCLRQWDDTAKIVNLDVPPVERYLNRISGLANGRVEEEI